MDLVLGVIVGLAILVFLVIAHELGHAIVAKRNGVVVEEFGVGFPPQAWKKKLKNGVLLSINWLPLGGFVKLQGEHDSADKKGDYGAVSFWSKTKILFAGVAMNWLVAAVLLMILAWTGLPEVIQDQYTIPSDTTYINQGVHIASLTSNHPAEKAGLKLGDEIISLNGNKISTPDRLVELTLENKGKQVEIIYNRDGIEKSVAIILGSGSAGGYLGAGLGQPRLIKTTWSAPIVGVVNTAQLTWATLQGIGNLVGNLTGGLISQLNPDANVRQKASTELKTAGDSVAGPIGILGTVFPSARKAGLTQLTLLTAVISLSLATMNVLPIPALDGGRWFLAAAYRLFKKKLTKEREEKVVSIGFMILMGLIILVTLGDVVKLF